MPIYEITSFRGGLSDYEDKGITGSFKFASNLDIRKAKDTLSSGQALVDEGNILQSVSASKSPSASYSPSPSTSPSISASVSPSPSFSPSIGSHSASISPSSSRSPSSSASVSASRSPSASTSPSPSPSGGLKTVFAGLIRWFVKCSDGNTYGFDNTGRVYKRIPDGAWFQVYNVGQAIKGAIERPSATGKTYLLFATNTNLHLKEIPGRSDWNDVNALTGWPKTNLTSADWHTMENIAGSIQIANKDTVALVGYDDSYTNEALDIIPGNIAKTIVERNGRASIGTVPASDPDKGVNAAIDAEVPLAQIGDDGDLYFADGVSSVPIKRFPGGGKVNPGGVANLIEQANFFEWEEDALSWISKQTVGNMSLWGVWNGDSGKNGIYTYGRKNKNHPMVLNLEYELDVDEIGAVTAVDGVILVSYRDGTDFGVKAVSQTTKAIGVYEGLDFKSPVKTPGEVSPWNKAELFMQPLPNGASVEFWYKINKTGSFIQAKTADGNTSYSVANGIKAVFRIGAEGQIFEPRVVLNPIGNNTPEVNRIRIYFD